MIKQEEIRELTAEHMFDAVGHLFSWNKAIIDTKEHYRKLADKLLKAQASKGVVIKMNKPDADFYYELLIEREMK